MINLQFIEHLVLNLIASRMGSSILSYLQPCTCLSLIQTNGYVARCDWAGGHRLPFPSWGQDSKICHPSPIMTNVREMRWWLSFYFGGGEAFIAGKTKGEILAPFLCMVASNPTTRMLLHDSWCLLGSNLVCGGASDLSVQPRKTRKKRGRKKLTILIVLSGRLVMIHYSIVVQGVGISILIYSSFWSFFVCLDVFRAL